MSLHEVNKPPAVDLREQVKRLEEMAERIPSLLFAEVDPDPYAELEIPEIPRRL